MNASQSTKTKSSPGNEANGKVKEVITIDDEDDAGEPEDDDDEEGVEEEQLEEYMEMLENLGNFADKVTINSLSMVAEDFSESYKSANALYKCIRTPLASPATSPDRKLPLVYVVDSILKNVKGQFVRIIERDAKNWFPRVYEVLGDEQRSKLRRVWNTWKEFGIFAEQSWKETGKCFLEEDRKVANAKSVADAKAKAAGIGRAPDGSLKLSPALRKRMQTLLDEMQSDGVDELDKVSLERLADINPDLLVQIKTAAEDMVNDRSGGGGTTSSGGGTSKQEMSSQSVVTETRPPEVVSRSAEWSKLNLNYLDKSNELIHELHHHVRIGSTSGTANLVGEDEDDASLRTSALAAASATANYLTTMLQQFQNQTSDKENQPPSFLGSTTGGGFSSGARTYMAVDPSLFTNDGLKVRNDNVVSTLYDAGLPFVSSADGRRFATQIDLSKHLDELFRRREVEKTMERTEERGWYGSDQMWTRKDEPTMSSTGMDGVDSSNAVPREEDTDPTKSTVPADESRDRCVICGVNFKMVFDNDDGEYKYSNCREVDVLNDEAAERESESMLVHLTCLRGLGSPEALTMDQVLQLQ